jgi:hypothetical protein
LCPTVESRDVYRARVRHIIYVILVTRHVMFTVLLPPARPPYCLQHARHNIMDCDAVLSGRLYLSCEGMSPHIMPGTERRPINRHSNNTKSRIANGGHMSTNKSTGMLIRESAKAIRARESDIDNNHEQQAQHNINENKIDRTSRCYILENSNLHSHVDSSFGIATKLRGARRQRKEFKWERKL